MSAWDLPRGCVGAGYFLSPRFSNSSVCVKMIQRWAQSLKKSLFIQTILSPGLERGNFEAVLDARDQIIRTWASWRRKLRGLADWRHGHRGETISWEKEGRGQYNYHTPRVGNRKPILQLYSRGESSLDWPSSKLYFQLPLQSNHFLFYVQN